MQEQWIYHNIMSYARMLAVALLLLVQTDLANSYL